MVLTPTVLTFDMSVQKSKSVRTICKLPVLSKHLPQAVHSHLAPQQWSN